MNDLPFTGERFIPGTPGEIWLEHWHRYHFAARWAAGRAVLDVACGEGYGTALLAREAASVVGVDISPQAVAHAQREYTSLANARFICASCTRIPLPDASIDLAVSFETLEHIEAQQEFIDELARVLKPGGVLLISCPNKREYSDNRGFTNEFHVRELYRDELASLLATRFPHTLWHGQRPTFYSVIAPQEGARATTAQLVETAEATPGESEPELSRPLYYLVAAARDPAPLSALQATVSVFADRDDWVYRDYEKVMREASEHWAGRQAGDQRIRELEARSTELEARAAALERELLEREAGLARARDEAAASRTALEERTREVDRRRGWRWWLRLPLVRLGILAE